MVSNQTDKRVGAMVVVAEEVIVEEWAVETLDTWVAVEVTKKMVETSPSMVATIFTEETVAETSDVKAEEGSSTSVNANVEAAVVAVVATITVTTDIIASPMIGVKVEDTITSTSVRTDRLRVRATSLAKIHPTRSRLSEQTVVCSAAAKTTSLRVALTAAVVTVTTDATTTQVAVTEVVQPPTGPSIRATTLSSRPVSRCKTLTMEEPLKATQVATKGKG